MRPSTVILTFIGTLWILAIAAGSYAIVNYQVTPGLGADPPKQWPKSSTIALSKDKDTLIMLVHPQCPCTQASVAELSRLMSRYTNRVKAYVLYFSPRSLPADWSERSALRAEAEQIPGVTVLDDIDFLEGKRFQAATSGQTFVYNPKGDLLFTGGITAARGQVGDSEGKRTLISVLDTEPQQAQKSMVFGCPLTNPVSSVESSPPSQTPIIQD